MTQKLKDPTKPAGYVFPEDVKDDGPVIANDGRELTSARKNPWYVLATIFHEIPEGAEPWKIDRDAIAKNRRIWNAWACSAIDREKWPDMAKDMNLEEAEFEPLSGKVMAKVLQRFRDRMDDPTAELPKPDATVNFQNTYFRNPLGFLKYVVAGYADFDSATFTGAALFNSATFTGLAFFRSATFTKKSSFSSAEFKSTTSFEEAQFEEFVPEFHAAKLFDHTKFTLPDDHSKHWPPIRRAKELEDNVEDKPKEARRLAKDQKDAYNRLRLFMNQTLQTESEQFFHRREMACKKVLDGDFMYWVYLLYEALSDYGYLVKRPTLMLFGNFVTGCVVIMWWLAFQTTIPSVEPATDAIGLSFANVFPFFGLGGRFVEAGFYAELPWGMKLWSSLQTIAGFISLFLLGLGLRSRFRLR